MKTDLLKFAAILLALALLASTPMLAATTTTPVALSATSYTDLGVGPMYLGASGGPVVYAIADTQPAGTAQGLGAVYPSVPAPLLSSTSHIWAKAAIPGASAIVSSGTGVSAPSTVTLGGNSGTPTQSSISVTNSSTTVLAAATATTFVKLCVALSAANGIWVRWDGGTATAAAPAEFMAPGQCDAWVKATGFLPTSQINAISATTVSVSLIFN